MLAAKNSRKRTLLGLTDTEIADLFGISPDGAFTAEMLMASIGIADHAADANPTRLGQAFDASRNIDAVAEDVALVNDDIAEIDADAKLDAVLDWDADVARSHLALHLDGAADRIDDAAELHQQPIAGSGSV